MAFFDEIGKTLADKSREAAKKAKDVAEILQDRKSTRLNSSH